ncbi:MAG: hypothetical protein JXA03_03430 [Bacteroidales bacterium]|nr:hypothetical protein [Bacteroidales bacterium]
MKLLEKILLICVMVIILSPPAMMFFPWVKEKPLSGDFVVPPQPRINMNDWLDGIYQEKYEPWANFHIGFHHSLFRLANQLDFSLFGKVRSDDIIRGKNDFFMEYDYIRAYSGIDYIGEKSLDRFIRRLTFLQKKLKADNNTDLIFVIEPGKAGFMPENIPERFPVNDTVMNNYRKMVELSAKHGLEFIDLNSYFLSLKDKTTYPLFTKYGTHWSQYGMSLAADSLIKYIEYTRNTDLPDYKIIRYEKEIRSRRPDYDIGNAMNLIFRLPETDTLAYPVYEFQKDNQAEKPRLLVIGDSFFWNIYNTELPFKLFKDAHFWYFNSLVFPETYMDTLLSQTLSLKEELYHNDVILIMVTERFLYKLAWGFVDDAYELFVPQTHYDEIHRIIERICLYDTWFGQILTKAEKSGSSLSETLSREAMYLLEQKNPGRFYRLYGPYSYRQSILSSSEWIESIEQKAAERNISLDSAISLDAAYMFEKNFPEQHTDYKRIMEFQKQIKKDTARWNRIMKMASEYCMTPDEAIMVETENEFWEILKEQ